MTENPKPPAGEPGAISDGRPPNPADSVPHTQLHTYARRVLVNHVTDRWRRRLREYATGALPAVAAPSG